MNGCLHIERFSIDVSSFSWWRMKRETLTMRRKETEVKEQRLKEGERERVCEREKE